MARKVTNRQHETQGETIQATVWIYLVKMSLCHCPENVIMKILASGQLKI